jgi:hypothetical protein
MDTLQRFLDGPVFGGDKPEGPAAALVERVRGRACWLGRSARRSGPRQRASRPPAAPRRRDARGWRTGSACGSRRDASRLLRARTLNLGRCHLLCSRRASLRQATADSLSGSDWGANMELCDMINLNVHECAPAARLPRCPCVPCVPCQPALLHDACAPGTRHLAAPLTHARRPGRHGKDAARAMRKRIANGTPKTQMLTLTARPPVRKP